MTSSFCKNVSEILIKYPKERAICVLNDIFELNTISTISQKDVVEVCISAGVFSQKMICECARTMTLIKNNSKNDQYIWRCKACKKKRSVRANSVVEDCKLPLTLSLSIMRCFLTRIQPKKVVEIFNLKFDRRAVYRLYSNLQVYLQHACQLSFTPMGGFGHIIEIDEMTFRKRKYKRGRIKVTFWILGFIDRDSNNVFLFPVLNRKKETMQHFIKKLIMDNSIVYTDEWAAYNWMGDDDSPYIHGSVNHSVNYVNPGKLN